ncbi:MAG: hypothetical protein LUQ20_00850 [Candidatus Methanoperedens sp.]|nr:hypothetical protein [Candidatus Methanoperedens sp.]
MGAVFIMVYIFYLQNSIEKYGELGVETIEKNDLKKNIFEVLMAIGTSLPELFVSVSAARKGYMTMALGISLEAMSPIYCGFLEFRLLSDQLS